MSLTLKTILTTALLALPTGGVVAGTDIPNIDDVAQIRLIGGWKMANGHLMGALQVTLAPGWKTYWRAGGGTGIPPTFDWQGSRNLKAVSFHWPSPELITVSGVTVIGYKNELVLPIEFIPKTGGQGIIARAKLQLGICKDVCLPVSKPVSLSIAANADNRDFLIDLALQEQPKTGVEAGVTATSCRIDKIKDGYRVTGRFTLPANGTKPEMVVFESPLKDVWIATSDTRREGGTLVSQADMVSLSGQDFNPDPANLRITVIGSDRAIDIRGCAAAS